MSWSLSAIYEDGDFDVTSLSNTEVEHHADQLVIAKEVVREIVDSGVLGNPTTKKFSVSINGHGNPNHEPDPAWANDFVSINVYQKAKEQPTVSNV